MSSLQQMNVQLYTIIKREVHIATDGADDPYIKAENNDSYYIYPKDLQAQLNQQGDENASHVNDTVDDYGPSGYATGPDVVKVEPEGCDIKTEDDDDDTDEPAKLIRCVYPECSFKSAYQSTIRRHLAHAHKDSLPAIHGCDTAGCTFAAVSQQALKLHRKETGHRKVMQVTYYDPPIRCSVEGCNYENRMRNHLGRHMMRKHQPQVIRYTDCEVSGCNFRCRKNSEMQRHFKRTHAELMGVVGPYACTVPGCQFRSFVRLVLKEHYDERHEVAEEAKVFACTWEGCQYRCRWKRTLNIHVRAVHLERPVYICGHDNCSYRATVKMNLSEHIICKHLNRKSPLYRCNVPECSFSTRWKQSLGYHKRFMHQEAALKCEDPNCDYKTRWRGHLKEHMRKHKAEYLTTVYRCEEPGCDASYKWKRSLQKHCLKKHSRKVRNTKEKKDADS